MSIVEDDFLARQATAIGGNEEKEVRNCRTAWFFKLTMIVLFLAPSFIAYYIGLRDGKTVAASEAQRSVSSLLKQTSQHSVRAVSILKAFSGRSFPFQIRYSDKWSLYISTEGYFKDSKSIELSSGSKTISIGTHGNPGRRPLKEWWESSLKTLDFQPPEPVKYIYKPYMTVNGIEMVRCFAYRAGQTRVDDILLIFSVGEEGFYVLGNAEIMKSEASEKELREILETFTVGKAGGKDIPPYIPPVNAAATSSLF